MITKIKLYLYRLILHYSKDIEIYLKRSIRFGFINNDLSPKKCKYCGSNSFNETITDTLDNIVMEKESHCTKCNKLSGYWVTGNWMP